MSHRNEWKEALIKQFEANQNWGLGILYPDWCELCEVQGIHTELKGETYWLDAGPENEDDWEGIENPYKISGLYRVCQDCYVDPAFKD